MRPLLGLVIAVLIVGGLWLADRSQADTQQRQLGEQHQRNLAALIATTIADSTVQIGRVATQQADAAADLARDQATAEASSAQLAAQRSAIATSVAATQTSARSTNTAITSR